MGAIAAIAAGAVLGGVGTWQNANAASKRQRFVQYIADTPGVNIGDIYTDTLGAAQTATPQAEALASEQNTFNQAEKDRALNADIPGYQKLQATRIRNAQNDLEGLISPQDSAALARRSAAYGVDSGTSLSAKPGGFERALQLRDFGIAQRDAEARGAAETASIIGTTPMAARVSSGSLLNIDPKTGLALRSNERSQKMDILLKKAGLKGASEIWGEAASSLGGALLSAGMGGLGGGSMGGGGGGGSPALSNSGGTWGGGNYYGSSLYNNGGYNFGGG